MAMYLPVLFSVYSTLHYLEEQFGPYGVDLTVIMIELFNEIFTGKVGRYGMYAGPLGSVKIQLPEDAGLTDVQIDAAMLEAHLLLVDEVGAAFPQLKDSANEGHYLYSGGPTALLYVPFGLGQDCPDEYRSKLVPAAALRHLHD